ncbi:MAG: phage tail tape measure protein [Acidaminococcaceae bacterium]|nr:phage tail tape measure protein [Acidaminococcaceae bacterium]
MADFVLSAVLSLRDQLTGRAKNAQKAIQGVRSAAEKAAPAVSGISSTLDKAGRSAETTAAKAERLKRSLSGIKSNYYTTIKGRDELSPVLDRVSAKIKRVTSSTAFANFKQNLGDKFSGGLKDMASGMMMGAGMQMLGGAGIGFGLYNGIKSAMDFDAAMSGVRAITNATQEDFDKLRSKALEMGATTKFTATESAQALNFMGMAGWNADQSVKGLPGIMHLAAASGEDLAMVSDIVTDSMSAFGLEAEKSGQFADVLAAAATKSNTNVGKMGYTFKYAAPLAGALGYSIQDVALAVGTMADSGIKGEQAGTSLRSLFNRLTTMPKQAAVAMDELGIKIKDDVTGKMKPLRTVLNDLRSSFKGLSEDQKTQYAAMLAGTEGMSGLLAIVNGNEKKFGELANAIDNSSGAAKRMADTRLDNLSGDLTYLSSAWDGLILKVMNGKATSGLRGFVQELNSLVNHFSESVDKHGLGVRSILDLVGKTVTDLKNKFLELDGIGSVLAGGALAGGIYKIYKGVKSIANLAGGTSSGLPGAGSLGGGGVGSMTVQAGTVIVNGNGVTGGSGGLPTAGGAGGGLAGAVSKWGSFKTFSKFALPLGLALTAYETYNAAPEKQAETAATGLSGLAGAEVGAAIGTAIAGPIGTVVGGALGHLAGTAVMDKAVNLDVRHHLEMEELENFSLSEIGLTEDEIWEDKDGIIDGAKDAGTAISSEFRRSADESTNAWSVAADDLSGIFARISAAASSVGSPSFSGAGVSANATGTLNFRGGLSQINEHGGELVDLPSGSRIYPAATTERILQREAQSSRQATPSVNISGNTFMVREEADINKIAYALLQMMNQSEMNYGGA